jgi:hypothetical protein
MQESGLIFTLRQRIKSNGHRLPSSLHRSAVPILPNHLDSITLHWGSSRPLEDKYRRPRLLIQSKKWCSFEQAGKIVEDYRLLLATTQQPPGYQLKRRVLKTDKSNRFILAELELNPGFDRCNLDSLYLRRPIKPFVDLNMVSRWLQSCEEHAHRPHKAHELFQEGFRLIDVTEASLVVKKELCNFVALSYVWGEADPFGLQTTKGNLQTLMQPTTAKARKGPM